MASPRAWSDAASEVIAAERLVMHGNGGRLYGIWRSQIGRPRDELTLITAWNDPDTGHEAMTSLLDAFDAVGFHTASTMRPTLRPADDTPPARQGNYAFRHFETPREHFPEFLDLCARAWPGFEAAYDSQVVGLWRFDERDPDPETVRSLLVTRRPDLAAWERSKRPEGEAETEVRRLLSRRYDLCTSTVVCTHTLLTAGDQEDTVRWS